MNRCETCTEIVPESSVSNFFCGELCQRLWHYHRSNKPEQSRTSRELWVWFEGVR